MKRPVQLSAIAGISFSPYTATAQRSWIPCTAQVETTSVSATKQTNTTVGMRYRDSAGDVYTTEFAPGTQTVIHSSLYDATHKVRHVLDGDTKRALGTAQIMGRFKPPSDLVPGQEMLDGNATTIYPIRNPGQAVNVGKAWVIDGTDIIVKTYSTLPGGGSYQMKLSGIKLHQEPDSKLFQLPPTYAVSTAHE